MSKLQSTLFIRHDVTSLQDEKIALLDYKFSHVGYSIYWRLLEYMGRADDCQIEFSKLEIIAKRCLFSDPEDVTEIVEYCLEIGLFLKSDDEKTFYSKRLKADWEEMNNKRKKAREAIQKRWGKYERNTGVLPAYNDSNTDLIQNKNKNKNKNNSCTADAVQSTRTREGTTAAGENDFCDTETYSDCVVELANAIEKRFNPSAMQAMPNTLRRTQALLQAIHAPGTDGNVTIQKVWDALKKLDTAEAIKSKKFNFSIQSFLDPDKFLKLLYGDYDNIVTKKTKTTPDLGVSFEELAKKGLYDHD